MTEASPVAESDTAVAEGDEPVGVRFGFGANWRRFLSALTQDRLQAAIHSLERRFGPDGLRDKRFLDIGSGSGLFSAAACKLGADVVSFDFDADSVACTETLRSQLGVGAERWRIERGSVLDAAYLDRLGEFDVVYAWGVLHHTGSLWTAVDHACGRVNAGGWLWIAIYNDQGAWSQYWTRLKRLYHQLPAWLRGPYVGLIGCTWGVYEWGLVRIPAAIGASVLRVVTLRNPFAPWSALVADVIADVIAAGRRRRTDRDDRGMSAWTDLVDWVGGYPFEVAKPEDVFAFVHARGFELRHLKTCGGGSGCNEFLFQRGESPQTADAPAASGKNGR
ncbi:MAG: class I SAM-dependent methyltransferase [Planctomycetaceae bacterium]|nr:class I SAM-dependent methyltransferase [Planctomycetaceae bacterium]